MRLSLLGSAMNNLSKAMSLLKTKSEVLQKESKDLFGKKFRGHISETLQWRN